MKTEKILFNDVLTLGFVVKSQHDFRYLNDNELDWTIVEFNMTERCFIDWNKQTQCCELIEIDSPHFGNIIRKEFIKDLNHLKAVIQSFSHRHKIVCA